MRINLHIVRCDLNEIRFEGDLTSDPYERRIAFASLSPGQGSFSDDRLYILSADELRSSVGSLTPHSSVLCLGVPPKDALVDAPRMDLLWTRSKIEREDLADRINALIASYSAWNDSLSKAFSVNKPLRKVAELSEPIFGNPLWMWDSQLQTVFHVATAEEYHLPDDYKMHHDGTPWPISEVNAVNSDFRNALSFEEPHVLPPMFGYEALCYNLFDKGSYIATLAVDNVNDREFNVRDKVLLKYLGDNMRFALKYEAHFSKHATYLVNEYLERLLTGEALPEPDLQNALANMGWGIRDSYFCILAHQSKETSYPDVFLIPTAEAICDMFPHTLFSITDGSILFVVNLSLSRAHPSQICGPLVEALAKRGLNLALGVSTPFSNFAHVRHFLDQAHEAIHIGERVDGKRSTYLFHDYILDAMIERCLAGTVPEALYLPGLSRLIRHDKAHDGDLVRTLRAYLTNGMSMKRTSEALFMHRNTLLTRLKSIEEIGRIDLDDHKTRTQLAMAFYFMDGVR